MKKRVLAVIAMAMAMTMVLTGCGGSSSASNNNNTSAPAAEDNKEAAPLEFTFADYGNSTMAPAKGYAHGIQAISDASEGRIKIDYVGDAQLGNESEMIQSLMDGTLQCAILGTSTFSKYTDMMEAFQIPFLITDYEKEYAAFTSEEGKALLAASEELGIKVIGFSENGIRHFANNKRAINTPADLNGLILRIVPSTMLQQAMELLGASPTPLNYGEVYTALQNKVIDGEEINITSLYAMKHYETIKYVSEIGMYPFPAVICVNLEWWNSLSAEDQKIIEDGFMAGTDELFATFLPDFEKEAKEACVNAGVEFNVIEDKAAFQELVQPIYDDYAGRDPKIAAFIEYVQGLN